MNQKAKYVGLFAILPLFMVAIAPDYIGEADALKAKGKPGSGADQFGSKTANIVCGDRLCSESDSTESKKTVTTNTQKDPHIEIFGLTGLGEGVYKVLFTVHAGSEDLPEGKLSASSDIAQKETLVTKVYADSVTYVPVLIQANDPNSISAELVE